MDAKNSAVAQDSGNLKPSLDGFPLDPNSAHFPSHQFINNFFEEIPKPFLASNVKPSEFASARKILNGSPGEQVIAVEAILLRRLASDQEFQRAGTLSRERCEYRDVLRKLTSLLLRKKLPFTASEVARLILIVAKGSGSRPFDDDFPSLMSLADRLRDEGQFTTELHDALNEFKKSFDTGGVWEDAKRRRVRESFTKLLAVTPFTPQAAPENITPANAAAIPTTLGWDHFPMREDDPLIAVHRQLDDYLKQSAPTIVDFWTIVPHKHEAGRALLVQPLPEMALTVRAIIARLTYWRSEENRRESLADPTPEDRTVNALLDVALAAMQRVEPGGTFPENPLAHCPFGLQPLLDELLKREPPLSSEDLEALVTFVISNSSNSVLVNISTTPVIICVENLADRSELSPALCQKLHAWRASINAKLRLGAENRTLVTRISALIGTEQTFGFESGEAWSDAAIADLKSMPPAECAKWIDLFRHCAKAESAKPTAKWLKAATGLVEDLGRATFKPRVLRWFELVAGPRTIRQATPHNSYSPDPNLLICEQNATVLRGLAWCCAGWNDAEISSALGNLAEVCFKKVRWLGPRCPRVGNACLYSLSNTSSESAAAQLSRLDSTVKQPTAKKRIGKSLDAAATLTGQTREDLEEKSVPTFDLNLEGTLARSFGEYSAQLQVVQSREVDIAWSRNDGKTFKAIPADVKRDHAAELKQLQKLAKDIEKMLAAQRIRLERLLMTERAWDFEAWRQRYLDHALLAGITRRLIWHFKLGDRTALGIWFQGKLIDIHGRPLEWLAPETRVRLWHPIGASMETVRDWRVWLESHEICQPFKQAHREVYILTDAELRTSNYSNRFAAHILGQHQFAALCGQRGWKYAFMGGFDGQTTPTLVLPAWNMAAEFWVDTAGEMASSGVAMHLATDQVRFIRDNTLLPLTDVPALVFSEVMRDVDLFVGVGSIGSDPAWHDNGEWAGGRQYWTTTSFGDLNATAKTRKEVLERLLPRLKIAKQCSFDEKFLIVRGSLRTYKIHLGSGNIQMEPNNQYLCIVPDRSGAANIEDKVFLPFEGDRTLSIILSKAFLLADDAKIKDTSILNQIKHR